MLNPVFHLGYELNLQVFAPIALLFSIGLGLVVFGVIAPFMGKWRLPRLWRVAIGCFLVLLGASLIHTVVNWKPAWLKGSAAKLRRENVDRFRVEKVGLLLDGFAEDQWSTLNEDKYHGAFQVQGKDPLEVRAFKSGDGQFMVDFVYGGNHDIRWGIRASSGYPDFLGDDSRTWMRSIREGAVVYLAW